MGVIGLIFWRARLGFRSELSKLFGFDAVLLDVDHFWPWPVVGSANLVGWDKPVSGMGSLNPFGGW